MFEDIKTKVLLPISVLIQAVLNLGRRSGLAGTLTVPSGGDPIAVSYKLYRSLVLQNVRVNPFDLKVFLKVNVK